MKKTKQSVIIVDDEKSVLEAMQTSLKGLSDNISIFDSPVKCLRDIAMGKHDLLITDINMPEMSGIEVVQQAKKIDPGLSVLVMTGYADVSLAIKSVKAGADNFVEKPFTHKQIRSIVKNTLAEQLKIGRDKLRKLTKAELEVLIHIVEGLGNNGIAHKSHRSVRTIEDHRRNLMHKLEVTNVVELIHRATAVGLYQPD